MGGRRLPSRWRPGGGGRGGPCPAPPLPSRRREAPRARPALRGAGLSGAAKWPPKGRSQRRRCRPRPWPFPPPCSAGKGPGRAGSAAGAGREGRKLPSELGAEGVRGGGTLPALLVVGSAQRITSCVSKKIANQCKNNLCVSRPGVVL